MQAEPGVLDEWLDTSQWSAVLQEWLDTSKWLAVLQEWLNSSQEWVGSMQQFTTEVCMSLVILVLTVLLVQTNRNKAVGMVSVESLNEVEERLAESRAEETRLKAIIESSQEPVEFLNQEIEKRDVVIQRLEGELTASADAISQKEDELLNMSTAPRTDNTQEAIEERDAIITSLDEKCRTAAGSIAALQNEIDLITDEKKQIQDELTHVQSRYVESEKAKESSDTQLRAEEQRLESEITALHEKLIQQEEESCDMKERISKWDGTSPRVINELRAQIKQLTELNEDSQSEAAQLRNLLKDEQAAANELTESAAICQKKCVALQAANDKLEREVANSIVKEGQTLVLEEMLSAADDKIAALEAAMEQNEGKVSNLQAELASTKSSERMTQDASPPALSPAREPLFTPPPQNGNNTYHSPPAPVSTSVPDTIEVVSERSGTPSSVALQYEDRKPSQVELLRMSHGMHADRERSAPKMTPSPTLYRVKVLFVKSDEKPIVQGTYEPMENTVHNGYPVWGCGHHRIFSSREGYWMVSADEKGPQKDVGRLVSSAMHDGKAPDEVPMWCYSDGNEWVTSKGTTVRARVLTREESIGSSSVSSASHSPAAQRHLAPSFVPNLPIPSRDEIRAIELGFAKGWRVLENGTAISPNNSKSFSPEDQRRVSFSPTNRDGTPTSSICTLYSTGNCRRGSSCPLLHNESNVAKTAQSLVDSKQQHIHSRSTYLMSPAGPAVLS